MDIRPYLVAPKLIEQPTWGGTYIASFKNWQEKPFANKKIGQSYELFSQSLLVPAITTADPSFGPDFEGKPEGAFPIGELIQLSPEKVLGESSMAKFGPKMSTLIKFTQAKGNSFQLHVKDGTKNTTWLPKPESWYYFEEGLATLGLSDVTRTEEYKAASSRIATEMNRLSHAITSGTSQLEDAKKQADAFIAKENIYQYVNTVVIPKETIVDIHAGGIHHSWEEDDSKYPNGNIVYEVQQEASDDASTLRSFDKGKIKEDGSIRPVQVEDYFTYIDKSPEINNPQTFLTRAKKLAETGAFSTSELFNTPYYSLHQIALKTEINSTDMAGTNTFHHIFVHNGSITVEHEKTKLTVGKGHSVFVPSVCEYRLTSQNGPAILLSTFI